MSSSSKRQGSTPGLNGRPFTKLGVLYRLGVLLVVCVQCGSSGNNSDDSTPDPSLPDDVDCILGELGCECRSQSECDPGLVCVSDECEADPNATPDDPDPTSTGDADSNTGTTSDGEDTSETGSTENDDATDDGDPTSTSG